MPRKRSLQGSVVDESSTGQYSDQSQLSTNQAEVFARLGEDEFKRKVAELARYILFADGKKVGIKRADMIKAVLKDYPKAFVKVFEEAKNIIKETFGFEVVQIFSDDGKSKGYILLNLIQRPLNDEGILEWGVESERMSLLLIVLSMIFMNEGTLKEASLWRSLKKLGIDKNKKNHPVFGDVCKLINEDFVKRSYIVRQKIVVPEGASYQYHMGTRSKSEISKRNILEFVSKVHGVDSIESWKMQYQQVVESEFDRVQEMDADTIDEIAN